MKEKILKTIEEIQGDKEHRHIVPALALYSEIYNKCNMSHSDIEATLNSLFAEGKIVYCMTINQLAFTINKHLNE